MREYSLEYLKELEQQLEGVLERDSNDFSGNPNKYRSETRKITEELHNCREWCKDNGLIPLTEQEKINKILDEKFPNRISKSIVEYEGKTYQIIYTPRLKSLSGKTVKRWEHEWREVTI